MGPKVKVEGNLFEEVHTEMIPKKKQMHLNFQESMTHSHILKRIYD
jgi:hypothetical protein